MKSFHKSIAIDLGGSRSRFYKNGQLLSDIPSDVITSGQQTISFISRGEIATLSTAERFLQKAIRTFHKPILGIFKNPYTALVSVPASIGEVGIRAFRDVMQGAGASEVYMLRDALAATLSLGLTANDISTFVDFGAGKTTITTLDGYDIKKCELLDICGKGLDIAIQLYLQRTYDLRISVETVRQLKENHLDLSKTATDWSISVAGKGKETGNDRIVSIQHSELVACISDDINELTDKIITHIGWLEDDLSEHIRQKGIYLTGNSFKMKGLVDFVAQKIPVQPESYAGIDYLGCGLQKMQTGKVPEMLSQYMIT